MATKTSGRKRRGKMNNRSMGTHDIAIGEKHGWKKSRRSDRRKC
jgi:hypothetical protein